MSKMAKVTIFSYGLLALEYVAILGIISVAWIPYLIFFKIILILLCTFVCAFVWLFTARHDLIDDVQSFVDDIAKDKVLFNGFWYKLMNNTHLLASIFLIGLAFAYEYILFGLVSILCIFIGKLYRKGVYKLCEVLEELEDAV